jgi:predicted O-methyltransferase YrrM
MKNMDNNIDNDTNICRYLWEFPIEPAENFFSILNDCNRGARTLCLISASVKLGLFDYLDDWISEEEIEMIFSYPHPVNDFLLSLVESGLIEYKEGKYKNTKVSSVYLSRNSPYFQGAYLEKMNRHLKDLWIHLSDIINSGPVMYQEEEFFSELSLPSMAQNAMCGRLQSVVQAIASLPEFPTMKKMIDLGGGHGLYAIALACKNSTLNAIVFDLPGVIPLTKKYIHSYNLQERVLVQGGNFLTDNIGDNYDLIFSSSNPSGKSPDMIKKISKGLKPGGYFVTVQPGDETVAYDPINELEFSLWTFENIKIPKKSWSKNKKFLTEEYLNALNTHKLSVQSISRISDPYIKNYGVSMLIAKKEL